MNNVKKLLAWVCISLILLSICGCGEGRVKDTEIEEPSLSNGVVDWNTMLHSAKGTGKEKRREAPFFYLTPIAYYTETSYEKTVNGINYMAYGVKLTGLSNMGVMTMINQTLQKSQKSVREDISWINEEEIDDIKNEYTDEVIVVPTNYSTVLLSVYGNVLSATIQYLYIYQVIDQEKQPLMQEDVYEGRLIYNFDLNDGRVVSLSDLFYHDIDYVGLLTPLMNKVGEQMHYPIIKKIDSFPNGYSTFAFTDGGLALGLPNNNPFTGEESWFVVDYSEIASALSPNTEELKSFFKPDVSFKKSAFEVKGIAYTQKEAIDPFTGQTISLPLVDGIAKNDEINRHLEAWYAELVSTETYTEDEKAKGGTIRVELSAPSGLISATAFIYIASQNRTVTKGYVFSAKTGELKKVQDILTANGRSKAGQAADTYNFRVGYDFTLAIPEQEGVREYLVFTGDDVNDMAFLG